MRITLILCPVWIKEAPPLATALLTASVKASNNEVCSFDLNNEFFRNCKEEYKNAWDPVFHKMWIEDNFIAKFISDNEELFKTTVENLLKTEAKIFGFSNYCTNINISLELAKRIKQEDENKVIIFGGPECAREHSGPSLIEKDFIDIVVTGEGDEVLPEVIRKIEKEGHVDFLRGCLVKRGKKVIDCGDSLPPVNLDSLKFADFTDFPVEFYDTIPLLSSRGCYYSCVFCSDRPFWKFYRSMSGERIYSEIKHHLKRFEFIKSFHFCDLLLNGNIDSLNKFCDLVIDAKLKDSADKACFSGFSWHGMAKIRSGMSLNFLKKMKKAGCVELTYGIESGSQDVLNKMRKGFDVVLAERQIKDTHMAGIRVILNFMLGFPGEDEHDFNKTLDFLRRNADYLSLVSPSEEICLDIYSYFRKHFEEFNIKSPINKDNHLWNRFWKTKDGENTFPERLRRVEIFCETANSLNIPLGRCAERVVSHKKDMLKSYAEYENSSKQ